MNYSKRIKECENSAINAWAEGRAVTKAGPWLVYIGTTNVCNNRCVVCAHHTSMRQERGFMGFETFKRIADQLPASVKKVYLMKQGEPFANKQLETFSEYLNKKRPDIHIGIHTNGILMKKERLAKLLPHIHSLGVSISAISASVYEKVHGTRSFDKVVENLKGVSDLLQSLEKGKRPHVFVDYVRQSGNDVEKEAEVVAFHRERFPGIASIDFHSVFNFQGEIEEGNLNVYNKLESRYFPCCVFPWGAMTFCHDGKLSYCFVEPRENRFLGDIRRQSFRTLWNNAESQVFRKRMHAKKFADLAKDGFYCHKCSWLWNLQSQSPRNLSVGYSLQQQLGLSEARFADVLESSPDRLFDAGVEAYLKGEIHQALGLFEVLASRGEPEKITTAAKKGTALCRKALQRYRDLARAQKLLVRESSRSLKTRNTYYKLMGNDG